MASTKKRHRKLGNTDKRIQAVRDNAYIDCAQGVKVSADIKACEQLADSIISEFFTGLQAGTIKSTDIFSFGKKSVRQRCANKGPLEFYDCQKTIISVVARIKTALDEEHREKKS